MGLLKMAVQLKNDKKPVFQRVELKKAYKLIKSPAVVATKGNFYNLTPYSWIMPLDYEPVTRVVFSSDPDNQSVANIRRTKQFAVCFPSNPKAPFLQLCGTVSNPKVDKFELFKIPGDRLSVVDAKIPKDRVNGWIEFRLIRMVEEGSMVLIMGEAVAAYELVE